MHLHMYIGASRISDSAVVNFQQDTVSRNGRLGYVLTTVHPCYSHCFDTFLCRQINTSLWQNVWTMVLTVCA